MQTPFGGFHRGTSEPVDDYVFSLTWQSMAMYNVMHVWLRFVRVMRHEYGTDDSQEASSAVAAGFNYRCNIEIENNEKAT